MEVKSSPFDRGARVCHLYGALSSFTFLKFNYILNFSATLMKQATLEQFGISKSFDDATKKRQLQEFLSVLKLLEPSKSIQRVKKEPRPRVIQ